MSFRKCCFGRRSPQVLRTPLLLHRRGLRVRSSHLLLQLGLRRQQEPANSPEQYPVLQLPRSSTSAHPIPLGHSPLGWLPERHPIPKVTMRRTPPEHRPDPREVRGQDPAVRRFDSDRLRLPAKRPLGRALRSGHTAESHGHGSQRLGAGHASLESTQEKEVAADRGC